MASPTRFPDLNDVVGRLVADVHAALDDNLVAIVLQGSFAIGGADEHSDVDFVTVLRDQLCNEEVQALQDVHQALFDLPCTWAQHLEGSYMPRDVLRSLDRRAEKLWYLDNGASQMIQHRHCNTTVVRHTVREHGVSLFGPPPDTLLDPIPQARLQGEILGVIEHWGPQILEDPGQWANRFYQGFITLHHCRAWCDLESGTLGSKQRGAAWAKERLGPAWHGLIDRAFDTRPDPAVSSRTPADPDDYARTLELVAHVIDAARTFAASAGIVSDWPQ